MAAQWLREKLISMIDSIIHVCNELVQWDGHIALFDGVRLPNDCATDARQPSRFSGESRSLGVLC